MRRGAKVVFHQSSSCITEPTRYRLGYRVMPEETLWVSGGYYTMLPNDSPSPETSKRQNTLRRSENTFRERITGRANETGLEQFSQALIASLY
jgi:hypothetical protein